MFAIPSVINIVVAIIIAIESIKSIDIDQIREKILHILYLSPDTLFFFFLVSHYFQEERAYQ